MFFFTTSEQIIYNYVFEIDCTELHRLFLKMLLYHDDWSWRQPKV